MLPTLLQSSVSTGSGAHRLTLHMLALSLTLLLAACPAANAHRLDECLQAVRFELQPDGIRIELDVTPGMEVLPAWMKVADANRDGVFSETEALAYGDLVKSSVQLHLNGKRVPLTLENAEAPTAQSLKDGNGWVRLTYRISAPGGRWRRGTHALHWRNDHFIEHSVHLSNALIPSDRRLQVVQQQRDETQRDYTLTFRR